MSAKDTSVTTQNVTATPAAEPLHVQDVAEQTFYTEGVQRLPIQRSLSVGAADDPLEQEADSMADHVMRMPDTFGGNTIQRTATPFLQREFSDEKEEGEGEDKQGAAGPEKEETAPAGDVQRKSITPFVQKQSSKEGGTVSSDLGSRIQSTKGNGSHIDGETRSFMESRFDADFSDVRLHTDTDAVQMSRELSAHAFTVGNDVYFNEGRYAPETDGGKHLLAHELTHTIQQTGGVQAKKQEPAVQRTEGEQVQRGFFGDLWEGIKSVASTVWGGIKTAAGAVWTGIKAVGGWAWDVIKSAGAWVWDFITWIPKRLWGLIKHIGTGIADVALWLADVVTVIKGDEGLLHWLGRAIVGGAAWIGRFFAKTLDLVGFAEFWTLATNIIKANSRPLTDTEKDETQKVYGGAISYWQVRIDEHSLISTIGATAKHADGMGVTTGHTINFNRTISAAPGNNDMAWLMHEMGHVAQYTAAGIQYMGEAIHAQATVGYDYGGGAALAGKNLRDFNREQQADILKDYYALVLTAPVPSLYATDYVRMKDQAQEGQF